MKKKLEAELMSIAHKILQLKNKSDVEVLLRETQKLYEKLSVLKFVEENFAHLQPTIGKIEVERQLEAAFEAEDQQKHSNQIVERESVSNEQKEEAFAERTQQDDSSSKEIETPQEVAAKNETTDEPISEIDKESKEEEISEEANLDQTDSDKIEEEQEESVSVSEEIEEEPVLEQEISDYVNSTEESDAAVLESNQENRSTEISEENIAGRTLNEELAETELAIEENSEEDSEAVVEENTSKADILKNEVEEKEEVLESKSEEDSHEDLESPTAFNSEEETQVRTLEIGTEEAIANDEVLQDKPEEEKFDPLGKLFKPAFDWDVLSNETALEEEKKEEVEKPSEPKAMQFTFDDLLGSSYKDPVFVKPADLERERIQAEERMMFDTPITKEEPKEIPVPKTYEAPRAASLNDKFSKGIIVGLNDRIAFVKNLFGNSNEDYNRVLSQMMTFNTMEEAKEFIEQMVKPDYHNWEGKEDYEERFLEVISKKFS